MIYRIAYKRRSVNLVNQGIVRWLEERDDYDSLVSYYELFDFYPWEIAELIGASYWSPMMDAYKRVNKY